MAKIYRVRDDAEEQLAEKRVQFIIEKKGDIKESDVLHTLIWKFLNKITLSDIEEYRQKVLKKD